jgi:dihydrofolate reductase
MILSHIACMSQNHVIGEKGKLPWHIPEDLKFFKSMTRGHCVIMGRKTFETLDKPLPKRLNLVVSKKVKLEDSAYENLVYFQGLDEAKSYARSKADEFGNEVFIAGGGEIYRQTLETVDRIYLTIIHQEFAGDAFYPKIPEGRFKVLQEESFSSPTAYSRITYARV